MFAWQFIISTKFMIVKGLGVILLNIVISYTFVAFNLVFL